MYIIVKRVLKDFDSWKTLVSSGNETRREKGSQGMSVYRSIKNPNEVYLVIEWEDHKSYLDYFNLPEVQKALADMGTTEIVEVSEEFSLEA